MNVKIEAVNILQEKPGRAENRPGCFMIGPVKCICRLAADTGRSWGKGRHSPLYPISKKHF